MATKDSKLLTLFEACEINPTEFTHHNHIQVAYEMLHKYGFLGTSAKYSDGISALATNAGAPQKFNVTITLAFLSLIAERIETTQHNSFEEFLAQNEDLLSRDVLDKWYSPKQLQSDFARTHFLLPRMGL